MLVEPRVGISIVVPLLNERESLAQLYARLTATLQDMGRPYEILFVDDGSTDGSAEVLDSLAAADPSVGVVHLRRNFGKAAALDAGFQRAQGEVVVTMDADLQDEPAEISKLLSKLQEGYDVVSGWKRERQDPVGKRIFSKIFNTVVALSSGIKLHDFNCGLKAYRRSALDNLLLYGELHRYVPVLLFWQGFRVGEVAVEHHARQFGTSKYGLGRLLSGFFDWLTVLLNTRYRARPLHLFGLVGLLLGLGGVGILGYLGVLWCMGARPIGNRPLLFLGLLLVMVGVQLVSTGLLGELINRGQHQERPACVVRSERPPRRKERSASHGALAKVPDLHAPKPS